MRSLNVYLTGGTLRSVKSHSILVPWKFVKFNCPATKINIALPEQSSDPIYLGNTDRDRSFFTGKIQGSVGDINTTTKRAESRA